MVFLKSLKNSAKILQFLGQYVVEMFPSICSAASSGENATQKRSALPFSFHETIFEFKILGAGMSLVSHESPQDSLIKKLTEYVKARGDPEKEAIDKE